MRASETVVPTAVAVIVALLMLGFGFLSLEPPAEQGLEVAVLAEDFRVGAPIEFAWTQVSRARAFELLVERIEADGPVEVHRVRVPPATTAFRWTPPRTLPAAEYEVTLRALLPAGKERQAKRSFALAERRS